ncbi:MAG: alginate lyase family protein [Candidatus Brocadiia bacterium]
MLDGIPPGLCAILFAALPVLALAAGAGGPRLSDAELFEALDLSREGLEGVRRAVEAGDLDAATHALAHYLRRRTSVPWHFDPHQVDRGVRHDKEAADRTVEGTIRVIGIWHTFPEGRIDWHYNPTTARDDLAPNREWQWQLNRMHFWRQLGRTYWATGDETYARTFVDHLRSWARQCPRPDHSGNRPGSAWRTIESGLRMLGSWPEAYHRFLHAPSFTDADLCLFLKLCIEHAVHLRRHHRGGGNWLTMEMQGLYTVGALFPELEKAAAWRAYAIRVLYRELDRQFLPDGAQAELTPGYHQVALRRIMDVPRLARVVGREDELPDDYVARAEKAYAYDLYLMTPDRDMPRFNDSWHVAVPAMLRRAAELFPHRRDFLWVATDGRQGAPPDHTSHFFSYAGYVAMRSGWEREANALFFDVGPLGIGHRHHDKLNVVLWAFGHELLFDGGGGQYEHSKWRSYDVDTFAHNTLLVDGQPQRRATARVDQPIDARWESTPGHDFAAGRYEGGYGRRDRRPAVHSRRVLFLKPDLFVVADTATPRDGQAHAYQVRWHLVPPRTATHEATSAVVTAAEEGPNLAVVPLLAEELEVRAVRAQEEPELLGWRSHKTGGEPWHPATTVLHTRKGAGRAHFLTLLVPLRAGQANPVTQVEARGATAAEVAFADGRRLLLRAQPEPGGGIQAAETLPDGTEGRRVEAGAAKER